MQTAQLWLFAYALWQEPKTDQDEEHCRKVNECLNNPPMPGSLGASGSSGHELSALGGEGGLQSLLGNMSHSQLMQLIGPAGLGGLGNAPLSLAPSHRCPFSACLQTRGFLSAMSVCSLCRSFGRCLSAGWGRAWSSMCIWSLPGVQHKWYSYLEGTVLAEIGLFVSMSVGGVEMT